MQSLRRYRLGVLAFACVVAAGCGGAGTLPAGPAAPGPPATAATGERPAAPDFSLEALDGQAVTLADSAGSVRLIDFWATWCAPCREEIPMLNELQARYGERGLRVVAISEETREVIREFVEREGVTYMNLVGTAEVAEAYGVLGLPTTYLVDREGRLVETFVGPKPRRVLEEKIEALLAASPAT